MQTTSETETREADSVQRPCSTAAPQIHKPDRRETYEWALRLIKFSSSRDFDRSYDWAVWCRKAATAGLNGDEKWLERIEKELTGYIRERKETGKR